MSQKSDSKRRSQNSKQGKSQRAIQEPQPVVIDENYFMQLMQMSVADLKVMLDELNVRNEALIPQKQHRDATFKKLVDKAAKLDAARAEESMKLDAMKKKVQNIASTTTTLQTMYNDNISPYNEITHKLDEDKAKLSQVSKKINEYQKSRDAFVGKLNKEAFEVDQKINENRSFCDEMYQELEATKQKLSAQEKIRDEICQARQEGEAAVVAADIEGLVQGLSTSKQVQEQKQKELDEICDKITLSECKIEERKMVKLDVEESLALKKKEVEETTAQIEIFEKRIENEQEFVEKIVRSKFKKQSEGLEKANLNIADVLRNHIETINANELLMDDLKREQQEKLEKIEELKKIELEMQQNEKLLEEKLNQTPIDVDQLQEQKKDLLEKLLDVKAKKSSTVREHHDRCSNYERKIKKELRKQTTLGFVDEEKSPSKSKDDGSDRKKSIDGSESQLSSSLAELAGIVPFEKMDFDLSVVPSLDYDSIDEDLK